MIFSQNRQMRFLLCTWCLAYCMIQNRQLKNVCRMNNPNYNGRSRRWHFIIMSLIFLSHSLPQRGKSEQWEREGNLSHETGNRDPHRVNRVKLPRSTNPSSSSGKPHFRGPLVPDAYWPPSNWHDSIYLSWAEEWCEKQTTENRSVQRKKEKMKF